MEAAYAGISAAASSDGAEGADTLKILFQHGGIVIEVFAVPALDLTRCFLFTKMHPSGHLHDEKWF